MVTATDIKKAHKAMAKARGYHKKEVMIVYDSKVGHREKVNTLYWLKRYKPSVE